MNAEVRPLNVLMIIDSLNIGGTETHVLALAKALKTRGHNVIIGSSGGPLTQQFVRAGLEVKVMSFQSDNPLYTNYTTLLEQTRTIVEEHKIDLIHAHLIAGLKIAAQISQEFLIPVVFTAHGMFYPRRQLQSLIDSTEQVIAVSLPVASYINMRIGYNKQQISIIPNGIDMSHFSPRSVENSFRKELGVDEDEFLVTLVSRIAWGKTRVIEEAINAVEALNERRKVRLAIVGSGPDSGFINSLAGMVNRRHNHDLILLTGAMLDPVEAYRGSDLVIGTARIALEAMGCCRPVIAAGNSGYVGIITPENFLDSWKLYFGDHDFLTNVSSGRLEKDLERVMDGALTTPDLEKLRRLVAKYFSIQQVTKDVEHVYYQVLGIEHEPTEESPSVLVDTTPVKRAPVQTATVPASETVKTTAPLDSPLVSVVIPTYNRANYLLECLESLKEQTYRPLEVVIVDDHSTDNTEQIVSQWKEAVADDEFSIVYYKLPRNLGFAIAQTMGYMLSTGAFIANHDSDDLSHPERIEMQVRFLQLDSEYSLVGTNYEVFSTDFSKRSKAHLVRYDNNIVKCYREGHHCVCFGSLLFRRQVLERIGGLTTFMNGAEDYEFVARAIVQGFHVQNLRNVLYYYRQHGDQRSKEFYSLRSSLTSFAGGETS
ncbi:MAG: glycosyltransferase [Firmicutes bacterium]|nr:glycosyltransferase [Bacillota bacterium]